MEQIVKGQKLTRVIFGLLAGILLIGHGAGGAQAAPAENVDPSVRCSVCGMYIAKFDNWLAQIHLADETVLYFDGAKDLLVFYFDPGEYSTAAPEDIKEIWVKDYYSLQWLDGRSAFYVIGSDIYGPMGKEFIPFATREAADSFLRDHKGEKVLLFSEISNDLVQSMRVGMKMLHLHKRK
jgi:nitrous oxide reductase accessory protein NosL